MRPYGVSLLRPTNRTCEGDQQQGGAGQEASTSASRAARVALQRMGPLPAAAQRSFRPSAGPGRWLHHTRACASGTRGGLQQACRAAPCLPLPPAPARPAAPRSCWLRRPWMDRSPRLQTSGRTCTGAAHHDFKFTGGWRYKERAEAQRKPLQARDGPGANVGWVQAYLFWACATVLSKGCRWMQVRLSIRRSSAQRKQRLTRVTTALLTPLAGRVTHWRWRSAPVWPVQLQQVYIVGAQPC